MSLRQTTGSVVCPSCGRLVGVKEGNCPNCGRSNPGMWGFTSVLRSLGQDMGLSAVVTAGCTILYLLALALDSSGINLQSLFGFLAPSLKSSVVLGASGSVPVFQYGRWWTVLTASWLHGSLLHIFFNMMWIRQLAPAVANLYGPGRATVIYLVAGVGGFVTSTCSVFFPGFVVKVMGGGGGFTLGASAALFGLLGALVHYSRRTGSSAMGQQIWSWVIALFVFGFVMSGVDNWAHLGGFLAGWGLSALFDPLKPERIDHLIAGLVGLLLTVIALGYSVWTGLPLLQTP